MKQEFTFYCCFPSLLSLLSELHIFLSDECSRNRHQPDNHRSEISATCRSSRELVYHERGYSHAGGFSRGNFATKPSQGEDFAEQENLHHNGYLQSIKAKCRKASVPSSSCFTDLSTQKIATFHRFQIKTVSTFAARI